MQVDVKKYLFVGPKADKEQFFSKAQAAGIVEFIHPEGKRQLALPSETQKYAQAIKTLRGYVQGQQIMKKDFDLAQRIVEEVLKAKEVKQSAEDDIRKKSQELEYIAPFGNFSMESVHQIEKETGRKVRFYYGKASKHFDEKQKELININSVEGTDYFIAITVEPIQLKDLLEIHVIHSAPHLRDHIHQLENLVTKKNEELKTLTRYNWLLHYAFVHELNQANLDFAKGAPRNLLDDGLFVIEGWVPNSKKSDLAQLTSSLNIYTEEVAIDKNETIPTYLENKGYKRVGEDVIHIFDVPSHQDKDPSAWVLVAFSLFFAMIVGDAGYGMIFLLAALAMKYKIKNLNGAAKRFVSLVTIVSVACILWGTLMNSFFAISFAPDNFWRLHAFNTWMLNKKADFHVKAHDDVYEYWLKKYPKIAQAKDGKEFIQAAQKENGSNEIIDKFSGNILLELALLIGSIHIILGMLRYVRKIPTGIGWVLFIIGCYLYFPYYLNATSLLHFIFGMPKAYGATFGVQLIYGGVGIAVLIAIIKGGFSGIFECMAAIQIFADIMSYLRIYALGYAGSIVATQINEMAVHLPLAIAIVAAVAAHALNIILSVMGGVIHGLRLNFLEWYRYSFEGGGKKFKPLELHFFE